MADFDFDPAMFGLKADHGALNTKPAIDGPLPEASGGSGGSGALRGGHQGVRGRGDLTNSSLRGSRRGRGRGRGKGQSIRIGDDRGSGGHSQDHPTKRVKTENPEEGRQKRQSGSGFFKPSMMQDPWKDLS
ncbi:MAG: hypothetical protein CYPHOPRED_002671 [Cyphobasidiales sp. Tagirdzhanova-0007]|nr:MAG: hypothetical protein CYPHOPRED_002671 [Cyphobasidiales sp. Tagirdzhanova-0007]